MLANSLSVMIVQASLAADLAGADPAAAVAAVAEVERSGRTALGETGRLLRLIQADDAGTHPQHGVADLPALADEYARAGLGIDLDVGGVAAPAADRRRALDLPDRAGGADQRAQARSGQPGPRPARA